MPGSPDSASPMRIAYFVREAYPTYRLDLDILFAEELASRGFKIDFIMQAASISQATGVQPWRRCRVYVGHTSSGTRFYHRLYKNLLSLWHDAKFLATVSRNTYDSIQVRDKILIAALGVVVARIRRLRFFYWLSFPISEGQIIRAQEGTARYPAISWLRGMVSQWVLYKWILPNSDFVFVQSEQMKRDVAARGVTESKLLPVPMGISSGDIRTREEKNGVRSDSDAPDLLIGYLGTLNVQRRLSVLIDALRLLRDTGLNARLLFVGDGDDPRDRATLEARAADLGVGNFIEITGFLPRAVALERISTVDVGVSPFFPTPVLLSTSPTKLVEYFALGLPVVANDHPEQRLVLARSRGGVCVPWGARHFARALRWLAFAGPACRRQLGERGREWVEGARTYERIADEVSGVYKRLHRGSILQ